LNAEGRWKLQPKERRRRWLISAQGTPKAFANFSPRLERSDYLGLSNIKLMISDLNTSKEQVLETERYELLQQLEDWLETPMLLGTLICHNRF